MTEISPELALVDPELAEAARALLPEPGRFRPASRIADGTRATAFASARPPSPEGKSVSVGPQASSWFRRPGPVAIAASVACAAATAAGAIAFTQLSAHPTSTAADNALGRQAALQARAARQVKAARTYTWPAVPDAQTYRITILRGRQPIYEATTRKPSLELPAELHLTPGEYTWSATPTFRNPSQKSVARPVVEETFKVAGP